jgi:hypothetical protein
MSDQKDRSAEWIACTGWWEHPGENKGVRNRIRQLQRETVPDTFIVSATT